MCRIFSLTVARIITNCGIELRSSPCLIPGLSFTLTTYTSSVVVEDRLAHDLVLPTRDAAISVKSHLDAMQEHRPVEAPLDIFLAGPHQEDPGTAMDGFRPFLKFM